MDVYKTGPVLTTEISSIHCLEESLHLRIRLQCEKEYNSAHYDVYFNSNCTENTSLKEQESGPRAKFFLFLLLCSPAQSHHSLTKAPRQRPVGMLEEGETRRIHAQLPTYTKPKPSWRKWSLWWAYPWALPHTTEPLSSTKFAESHQAEQSSITLFLSFRKHSINISISSQERLPYNFLNYFLSKFEMHW